MKQSNSRMSAGEKARLRRLRTKYRKRMLLVGVIFFILGLVAGALVYGWYTGRHPSDAPVSAVTATEAPNAGTLTPVPEQASPFGGEETTDAEPEPTEASFTQSGQVAATEAPAEATEAPVVETATEAPVETATAATEAPAAEPVAEPTGEAAPVETEAAQLPDIEGEPGADAQLPDIGGASTPAADLPSGQVIEQDPAGVEPAAEPEQPEAPETDDPVVAALLSEPDVIAVVPFGDSYTYSTQINMDGTARVSAADPMFETIRFTQTMKDFMRPSDFANKYATEYRLDGTEAGAAFELELGEYVGQSTIIPQNVVDVSFRSVSGQSTERGYQLMDKEIGGNYDVAVQPHAPKTLYKRYAYSNMGEEMTYLVVTTYTNGQAQKILFELESDEPEPEPEIIYPVLQKGTRNDDVRTLQERLMELGYLEGKADGDFGKKTQDAVKAAQEAFGLEATGIADNEFQHKLYEGMDSLPIPTTMQGTEDAEAAAQN